MNETVNKHGGSSRFHAAIFLYLQQVDPDTNIYLKTCVTMIDLTCVERSTKAKEKCYGGSDAIAWYLANRKGKQHLRFRRYAGLYNQL